MPEIISFHSTDEVFTESKTGFFQEVSQLFLSLDKFTKYSIYTLLLFFLVTTVGINLSLITNTSGSYTTVAKATRTDELTSLKEKSQSLIFLVNKYNNANEEKKPAIYTELAVITLERKLALQKLIRTNPTSASTVILANTIHAKLPQALLINVEKPTTEEGIITISSDLSKKTPDTIYSLQTATHNYTLRLANSAPSFPTGSKVRITGYTLDTDFLITSEQNIVQLP